MNWDKINKEAMDKATKVLEKGFNAEAFICLSLANNNHFDELPNSYVDEDIVTMKDEFVKYMRAKSLYRDKKINIDELTSIFEQLLRQSYKIMNEILHSCETEEERNKCLECLEKMGKLN